MFNYANLLCAQIEKLDVEIGDMRKEYDFLKGGTVGAPDAAKQKILTELEEKWNRCDKKSEGYELKFQQALKTLTSVKAGLSSIYARLGCAGCAQTQQAEESLQALSQEGVCEGNMLQYLAIIEKRTNEMLILHHALQDGDEEEVEVQTKETGQLQIKLPSTVEDYTDDEDEDEEDDLRPFTREELKLKTQRGLQRKHEKGARKQNRGG